MNKIFDQVSKDLEIACTKVKSYKSKAKHLRTELDLLKTEWADLEFKRPLQSVNSFLSSNALANDLRNLCQEVHRLGLKDTIDMTKNEFPDVLLQWENSELFDHSMSKESVEALGDLFRTTQKGAKHDSKHSTQSFN
ncbi:hypothetical protein ACH5RR_025871 [Cinchona calisaya]|uniref:Uncharacterized protein n=1 Tax=Cinchona calisaya TaxID=153742 RepID=A0ABD2Z1Y8_9GENT